MELYEIMFIVRPDLETEEHEEVLNSLKETITKNEGTLRKIADWRKRRLAYEIDKFVEGHYYLVYFDGHGTTIPEIEHFFRVTDAVIRFMIVRAEEKDLETIEAAEGTEAVEAVEVQDIAAEGKTNDSEDAAVEPVVAVEIEEPGVDGDVEESSKQEDEQEQEEEPEEPV